MLSSVPLRLVWYRVATYPVWYRVATYPVWYGSGQRGRFEARAAADTEVDICHTPPFWDVLPDAQFVIFYVYTTNHILMGVSLGRCCLSFRFQTCDIFWKSLNNLHICRDQERRPPLFDSAVNWSHLIFARKITHLDTFVTFCRTMLPDLKSTRHVLSNPSRNRSVCAIVVFLDTGRLSSNWSFFS